MVAVETAFADRHPRKSGRVGRRFDLLVKVDIATMANSLEGRSPLSDHQVMEFAARLPPT